MITATRKQSGLVTAHFPEHVVHEFPCPHCGGMIIDGVCPTCSWNVRCSWCGRLKVAIDKNGNGIFKFTFGPQIPGESSTACPSCAKNIRDGLRHALAEKNAIKSGTGEHQCQ
jgi:hypothetical protein